MTFDIRDGAMTISANGRNVVSSADRLLHTLTRNINGVRTFGAIGSSGSVVNVKNTYDLGACHADANVIYGGFRFAVSGPNAFNRWHSVLGQGMIVWVFDGEPGFRSRLGSNLGLAQFMGYEFRASAGRVYLDQTIFLSDTPLQYVIKAHSLTYRLKAGRFT